MKHSARAPQRRRSRSLNASSSIDRAVARSLEMLEPRMLMTGSVLATVVNDLNGNAKRDAGEPPLQGWTVFVDLDRSGTLDFDEPSGATNASGQVRFDGLGNGREDIVEVPPSGWSPSPGQTVAQRVNISNNQTTNVLFLNVNVPTPGGRVQGTVWNDVNGDGVRASSDPGIPGWTVFIDLNEDKFLEEGEPSAVTDANGFYSIGDLSPGRYRLRQVTQSGWDSTLGGVGGSTNVDISSTATRTVDFGNFNAAGLGALNGHIYNDVNADGFRAASDPAMSDWTVFLDLNSDGAQQKSEPTAVTDEAGAFSFPSIAVGTYRVTEVLKDGWLRSPSQPAFFSATVQNEDPANVTFLNYTPTLGSISGKVWNDADGNGSSAGEAGLSGWTVFIDGNANGSVDGDEVSATTNDVGAYTLAGVPIGAIEVREIPANGWTATSPGTGSQVVNVLNGTDVVGINFGNKQRTDGTIAGVAFADTDKDGTRDAGEKGLANIPVWLDLNNDGVKDAGEPSTTTSADLFYTPAVNEAGTYSFTHLGAGTFHVRETVSDVLSATPASVRAQTVELGVGEQRTLNFANRYRPAEVHGVVFDDVNRNHIQDADEPGIAGVSVYLDLNRDNKYQRSEPRQVTAADGSYAFTNLAPGSYVVRQMPHSGRDHSYPTTTSGILWPTGVSNPARGNVSPTSITLSPADGVTEHRNVSLTLPGGGSSLTNMVDVFLLFDDTGSFTANSPIVREAFPQIISQLQASMPDVDLGFGVGRLEEYANFASEASTGRPFVLNQPIVAQNTPGFSTAIQAALDRTAPGYGGDGPETTVEALFQTVTGAGFDGNNNGTTTDSGAAGQVNTQLTPGDSGDVPSFGSFTVDAAGNVLPAAGTIGGAGFRAGALPIILTATDIGFAYQPKGETTITGLNGVTLPVSAFTEQSRATTPFGAGAGLQETVTGLNALGALVIGLGTNGQSNIDPRQGLEAFARLTGAVNQSTTTIANGTVDPIAPGDPMYFQISSGFGPSVANGVVTAIQNAAMNVSYDIQIKSSDSRVHLDGAPEVIHNVGSGDTATFDAAFEGDGRPHRFDLEFVRAGTGVVLGSIPVVMGTPIEGDGYEYEDMEDGEVHHSSHFGSYVNTSSAPNAAPSFTKGADQALAPDVTGEQTVTGWATDISAGPASEADQIVDFVATNDNEAMFSVQPTIAYDGTLTYTLAPGASGTATVTVILTDTGGTENGGQDTSAAQTFTINATGTAGPLTISGAFAFSTDQTLTLDFNQDVGGALDASKLTIVNRTTGAPVAFSISAYNATTHRATIAFDAPLADGNYRVSIAAGSLPNQTAAFTQDFFVLAGDANRDRHVDAADGAILAANLNTSGTFEDGDFNYDGTINSADQSILDNSMQLWLPAQGALALPTGGGADQTRLTRESASLLDVFSGSHSTTPAYRIYTGAIETSLNVNTGNGDDALVLDYSHGDLVRSGIEIRYDGGAGADSLFIIGTSAADVTAIASDSVTFGTAVATVANNERVVFDGKLGFDSLTIATGASVELNATQQLATLSIAADGKLDVLDNDLVVQNTPKATIEQYITTAYNFGDWSGNGGLFSSTARENANGNTTLGVMSGDEFANNNGGAFNGYTPTANDVLVKYTYFGDVDFNGQVDVSDYNLIDFGFSSHLTGWTNGDADYSGGPTDVSDYNLIDFAFSTQGGAL